MVMKILILIFFLEIKESKITRGHNYTLVKKQSRLIIIIIYTTYIAPYIWPVWPFIGAEEGPSKY